MVMAPERFVHAARRAALFVALAGFLSAGAGDAFGFHACPHHDRVPAEASHSAPYADVHGAAGVQESHHGRAPEHGSGPCTCMGGACVSVALALPGVRMADAQMVAPVRRLPHRPAVVARSIVRSSYQHPFATAPPNA
jgi:hypothetical protein